MSVYFEKTMFKTYLPNFVTKLLIEEKLLAIKVNN